MEFHIAEAIELVKTLAETENLTHSEALTAFFYEADMSFEDASIVKAAFFEDYTLKEMAEDSLSNAFRTVFVEGVEDLQEVDTKETGEGTKYKVRVKDRNSQSSYTRYATRAKIAELRANPNIASVELTDHGSTGEDDKGERTAAAKRGDRDGDGKVESGSKEHAGVVHNAIQRKKGGTPDGQDTRKEEVEVEVEEGIDFKGAAREQARRDKIQDEKDKKNPSGKDRRLALRKFRPGASQEERAEGGRDSMREKGTSPKKDGKKMFEQYLELRAARAAAEVEEGWKPDPTEKRAKKAAKIARDEAIESGKRDRDRDNDKVKDLYKRRMAVDFKKKKSQIGEGVVTEADLVDAGRENQGERDGKKLTGKGVDNKPSIKLMPVIDESVVTESGESVAQQRVHGSSMNDSVRESIRDLFSEECCPKCGTPECTCEGKEEEKPKKKKKATIDESGMPIFETEQESRNNARPGPSKEMIDPPADPQGPVGHMNPKGEPKRWKEPGEAPGDRRPNRKKDKSLPNEDGTVPNGAGV